MIPNECKRLAEVDFPIAAVGSAVMDREKKFPVPRGLPSTMHHWWARRPLASSRAMLLALLLPDPCDSDCPDRFKERARQVLLKMHGRPAEWQQQVATDAGLRRMLIRFISDFAVWDNSAIPAYLDTGRALVDAAHPGESPLVVDPFAGGGSIPLEALRLDCDAFASDLNPVACLILRTLLEDIPRHGSGLVDELRAAGERIKAEAERQLAELYPKDSDGATPIAYLWARTVRCEAPDCGAEMPLMRSLWLCRKANRKIALKPSVTRQYGSPPRVSLEIFEPEAASEVAGSTVSRARATCLCCRAVLPPDRVRAQLAAQRGGANATFDDNGNRTGGARLTAVVTRRPGERRRGYRLPTDADYAAVRASQKRLAQVLDGWDRGGRQGLSPVPDESTPAGGGSGAGRAFSVQRYGMLQWGDLFTARQLVSLATIADRIASTYNAVGAQHIAELLAMALDKVASHRRCNSSRGVGSFENLNSRRRPTPVPARVSPTEAVRAEIDELFGSGRDIAEVLEEVMRLSARLVLQQVLEDEVTSWLGRGWNSRAGGGRAGQRNGYGEVTVKTTAGPLALKRPKLRNTTEAFASQLLGKGVVRSEPLEALVISAWVRGLSDRDIEALLAEALGPEAALSRSTASRICARLRDEFDTFRSSDLSDIELDYLFVDGSHFKMHGGSRAEPVLVAYGITTLGRPVLLAVEPGGDESYDAWAGFLDDLAERGLRSPLLVVSDGAAGLIGAVEQKMPQSLRQRCLIHRARNVLAKVPAGRRDELKAAFWAIFDLDDDIEPGQEAVSAAQAGIDGFARRYQREFPAAVRCLLADRQALTAHLRLPAAHWRRIRHTNLIERTFGETRRRVKVIGRLPGETSCLTLVWAVLDRASNGWRGLTYTPAIARALTELRHQLHQPAHTNTDQPDHTVTRAA